MCWSGSPSRCACEITFWVVPALRCACVQWHRGERASPWSSCSRLCPCQLPLDAAEPMPMDDLMFLQRFIFIFCHGWYGKEKPCVQCCLPHLYFGYCQVRPSYPMPVGSGQERHVTKRAGCKKHSDCSGKSACSFSASSFLGSCCCWSAKSFFPHHEIQSNANGQ